ncbi:MAG: signal peptidase I [Peptoniphilaceae bacterium]|uniref:signal peptidase I n=1 Tax=Parvimonas sp. TaxID=1944660 RepID=UPI0025FAE0AF|nr:signal peptidase I [Parvimonas sp.]MCI5997173.1 signal peptidase I [Parvimonas sp.]MDD7764266.1 signal peptidase I [Peptoniphilaceae bacterium]MDY3051529.1 signal peptidase I [Parvimonas sp.]
MDSDRDLFIDSENKDSENSEKNICKKDSFLNTVIDYVKVIVIALVLSFGLRTFVVSSTVVDGRSMNPTVNHGDRLLVNKLFFMKKNITRGDIIDFYVPSAKKYYLKRVIGVEGDTVEIIENRVYLNGKMLEEDYVSTNITTPHNENTKWVVPKDHIFVLGDNRSNSRDGRDLGVVPRSDIVGKVVLRYYPFNSFGGLK